MKRILSVCLVLCLFMAMLPSVTAAAAEYGVVHGGWLRLRAAPSFDADTINSYFTGTMVTILGTTGGWYRVQTPDGRTGFMYSAYVTPGVSGGTGGNRVWSSNGYGVRLRTGPGTGYRVLAVYSVGTPLTVLEQGVFWSRIQIGSVTGYMMNQFIVGGGAPIPSPSPTGNATITSKNGFGVRLRTGPSTSKSIIGVYSVGTYVTVLDFGSTWCRIQVGSRVGYMMTEFLDFYSNREVTYVGLNSTTPMVGSILYASSITPANATVSYSWLVDGVVRGTAATYTVMPADTGKTIQLKVTGTGDYTGSASSAATSVVTATTVLTGVSLNNNSPYVGVTLNASITPSGATAQYVWYVGGSQVSNASTYTVAAGDVGSKISLTVTGTGAYTGSVSSPETAAVTATATPIAPTITGAASMSLTVGYAATETGVYTMGGTPAPTVSKTSGDAAITWNDSTKRLDITAGLAAGSYPVVLTATNGTLPNATLMFTLTVNTAVAPSLTGPTTMTLTEGYAATSTGAYIIDGTPTPTVSKTSGDAAITWNDSTKCLNIAAGLAAGNYPVELIATNGTLPNATLTFTLTVNTAVAPSLTGPMAMSLPEGYTATSTGAYILAGTAPVNVTIAGGPASITWDDANKRLDIAAGLVIGSYTVVLTASNGTLPNDTLTFVLTVDPVIPQFVSGPTIWNVDLTDPTTYTSTPFVISGSAFDVNTTLIAYLIWNNGSQCLTISPSVPPATYSVTLTAINAAGSDTHTLDIIVIP